MPVLTNAGEVAHLAILDKDTNGVIVNANRLYLAAVQGSFPEIQTIDDLIGKEDTYFYPADLAAKFRDDDQQGLRSGQTWVGDEVNEPVGGK